MTNNDKQLANITFCAFTYSVSVPECCVERLSVWEEQILNVCQTRHLKLLWPLLNHLPAKNKTTVIALVIILLHCIATASALEEQLFEACRMCISAALGKIHLKISCLISYFFVNIYEFQ